ncbi:MAG: hypothetical protein RBJ76_13760 [Stenomitos frigidus ULC029]
MPELKPRPIPKVGDVVFYRFADHVHKLALVTHVYNEGNPESPLDLVVAETGKKIYLGVVYSPTEPASWSWTGFELVPPTAKLPNYELDLDWLFEYHPPTEATVSQHNAIKAGARAFVEVILANAPVAADWTTAIRQVREAMYTAAAAVALEGRLYKQ